MGTLLLCRLVPRSIGQSVKNLKTSLFIDKFCQGFEFELEHGNLLPRLLYLIVIRLYFLLTSLVLFLQDNQILFENFLRAGKLVVHQLELI